MYIDEYTMEYLVTFYLANKGESKDIFSILPYEAAVYTGKEDDVLEKVAAVLKKSPRGGGMPGGHHSEKAYDFDKNQQKYDKAIAKILSEEQQ